MPGGSRQLLDLLAGFRPTGGTEAADLAVLLELARSATDVWSAELPLHVTASALVVHVETRRVLLRWQERQQAWLQVGGHGEPGETDPLTIARREAVEETGLSDVQPWPDARLLHAVVVPVAATADSPAHRHGDLRFVLATGTPEAIRPERPGAALRWLSLPEATALTSEPNLRETIDRLGRLLDADSVG